MRLVTIGSVALFAASVAGFAWSGLTAYERAEESRDGLMRREESMRRLLTDVTPVSEAEYAATVAERDWTADLVAQRLSILVEGGFAPPPEPLTAQIDRARFPSLAPDAPLRAALIDVARDRPRVDAALSRLLELLHSHGIYELESLTLAADGDLVDVPGVPGLAAVRLSLVVVSEVPELLDLIESLVPGRGGRPVLSVVTASLRRIEPELWPDAPMGLISPPVQLAVTLDGLFSVAAARDGMEGP